MARNFRTCLCIAGTFLFLPQVSPVYAADLNDYCIVPPFIAQSVPPLVLLDIGRDHKLFYQAYNSAVDLNSDGRLDVEYDHSIDYYGYFDPEKCYTYSSTPSPGKFSPVSAATDKFCSSSGGEWSGNVLNWITMTRADVLRKVLYGGYRVLDSTSATVLERSFVPQDAHSWGQELTGRLCGNGSAYTNSCSTSLDCDQGYTCTDKSLQLVGFAAADAPTTCTADPVTDVQIGKMLVARYWHSSGKNCGVGTPAGMIGSYEPNQLFRYDYVNGFADAAVGTDTDSLDPGRNHYGDNYNIAVVADFAVGSGGSEEGVWAFAIDGDDDVELQIDGAVIASYYGCHGPAGNQSHAGTVVLSAGVHRLVVRHFERGGGEGVRVWYKKPSTTQGSDPWISFGGGTLAISAPDIVSGNDCSIRTTEFVTTGSPSTGTVVNGTRKQHLFCNTSLGSGTSDHPLLRVLSNKTNRIWDWSAKERPVCDSSLGTPTDYTVRVGVCVDGMTEPNCKDYSGTKKPVGLLQKFGEGDRNDRVCSKNFSTTCSSDTTCLDAGLGLCINKAPMYFGMMTGSYVKNESGGVLRKNFGDILDETSTNGIFQTSENAPGNIIQTLDRLKIVGYRYSSFSYEDASGGNCGWITSRSLSEGECRNWGNPLAEIVYESLRYVAGKGAPTADFTYSTTADSGLSLSKPSWGYRSGSDTYQPYDIYPSCSKPFFLLLSDVNPSYDSDQVPGSYHAKPDGSFFSEDGSSSDGNYLHLGETQSDGKSLLNSLAARIGTQETINDREWFIGQSGSAFDTLCTSKSVDNLDTVRGLCPEEPTKRGSYYTAALAYYGKTLMKSKTGNPDVTTYAVALSSPMADFRIKAGSGHVTLVPVAKSISGTHGVYEACAAKCSLSASDDGLNLGSCAADTFCPTNQMVNFFVDDIRYNSAKDVIYARFRINFEDVEQGADHDMDSIVAYEICTQAGIDARLGTCAGSLGSGLQIKVSSEYAGGSIDQVLGFIISGTTADGTYLVVKDKDVGAADGNTPAAVGNLGLAWQKTFTPSGSAAGFLKNPLWYAAKWGGFTDMNGNNLPDQAEEWHRDCEGSNCDPDNYFLVQNPLRLEEQLNQALTGILKRTASGTAASMLSNSEGSGANILQAVFHPEKTFDNQTKAKWVGELQNLWYYIDPKLADSTIREDTDFASTTPIHTLNLRNDYVTRFFFDSGSNQTRVQLLEDSDGNGSGDVSVETVATDDVKSIWRAGKLLWQRNMSADPRRIVTTIDGANFLDFSTSNVVALQPYLQAGTTEEAEKIIKYVHGIDGAEFSPPDPAFRSRTVQIGSTSNVWKLGDIISSTPRLQSGNKLNTFDSVYGDASYLAFVNTSQYRSRGMVYAGANDGMLHAFRLGQLEIKRSGATKATLSGSDLGHEEWSFVPRHTLPYLTYLKDTNYNHLYFVDGPVQLFEASIGVPGGCSTDYSMCQKQVSAPEGNWRSILIGSTGIGGASRKVCSGTAPCVEAPITDPSDSSKALGYSSYFALDITDPSSPALLWEFSHPDLGFATSGASIVRIGDRDKNGKWFAVIGSGPTGPIDTTTHQFLAQSDQSLKLFVLDLRTGDLLRTIDTTASPYNMTDLQNAFAGSLSGGQTDTDKWDNSSNGYYKDDVIYFGYVKKNGSGAGAAWNQGGIMRLITGDNADPNQWSVSKVIDGIGPVVTGVPRLIDRGGKRLWLYAGTGRYYFKGDDNAGQRMILGVKEPCYTVANDIDGACTAGPLSLDDLTDQSAANASDSLTGSRDKGWFITLDPESSSYGAERIVTDPVALTNGTVYFTSFKPTGDICGFGGSSYVWVTKFDTGVQPPQRVLVGKMILQLSTGSFEEVPIQESFTARGGRRTDEGLTGKPPGDPPPVVTNAANKPLKRVLHIQEK